MGGTNDGVIASSAARYGDGETSATERLEASFDEGIQEGSASHLVLLQGANHFTFADPSDGTTGRPFLDGEQSRPGAEYRNLIAALVRSFIDQVCGRPGKSLESQLATAPDHVHSHHTK